MRSPFGTRLRETWSEFSLVMAYRELLRNLVMRDLKVRYKRSVLGFLWVMLNPLLMMLVIYTVFSQLFTDKLSNYSAYVISGIVLWNMFAQSTSVATRSFIGNATLLKKIYIPKLVFPVSTVLSGLVNFCFSLVPLAIITALTGSSLTPRILLLPACIAEVLIFCIGIALIVSTVVVFFHDAIYIYEVLLLAGMYFSPIFYPVSILPPGVMQLMELNPMYHYLSLFRGFLYDSSLDAVALSFHLCYGLLFALLSFATGTVLYVRYRNKLLFYL